MPLASDVKQQIMNDYATVELPPHVNIDLVLPLEDIAAELNRLGRAS